MEARKGEGNEKDSSDPIDQVENTKGAKKLEEEFFLFSGYTKKISGGRKLNNNFLCPFVVFFRSFLFLYVRKRLDVHAQRIPWKAEEDSEK